MLIEIPDSHPYFMIIYDWLVNHWDEVEITSELGLVVFRSDGIEINYYKRNYQLSEELLGFILLQFKGPTL